MVILVEGPDIARLYALCIRVIVNQRVLALILADGLRNVS